MSKLTTSSYRLLAAFRYEMRKFLAFSEQAARAAGIEPGQHQLLLALRGLPADQRPTMGTVAERLCVQHHTAVAMVDKLEARQFLRRERGEADRREVLLFLTDEGDRMLRGLSTLHRRQLAVVGPHLVEALQALVLGTDLDEPPGAAAPASAASRRIARKAASPARGAARGRPSRRAASLRRA